MAGGRSKMANQDAASEIIVAWEPPDLLLMQYRGHLTAAHIERAVAESKRCIGEQPYHIALLDISKLQGMTPEARKIAVASSDAVNIRGVAVIGASFHFKVLGRLLGRAAQLVYRAKDNPLEFFDSEAEARVWLKERTRLLEKEYSSRGRET